MSNLIVISPFLILSGTAILIIIGNLILKKMSNELWVAVMFGLGAISTAYSVFFLWGENNVAFEKLYITDSFALIFIAILLINMVLCWLMARNPYEKEYLAYPEFTAGLLLATVGMIVMVSTTNLLLAFLGFEVLSICLYFLIGMNKNNINSYEAVIKYLLIVVFSSAFILYGIAFLFGASGSLDINVIFKSNLLGGEDNRCFHLGLLLIVIGFGLRVGLAPFHMWTSDIFSKAPLPVAAFMISGVITSVFSVLLRISLSLPAKLPEQWIVILSVTAALTIVWGNLLALVQKNVKKMLTYSAIAHIGYILIGLISKNHMGTNSVIFYLLTFTLMNTGIWATVTYFSNPKKEFDSIDDYKGLVIKQPVAAFVMAVFLLSLAGLPPFSGFFSRFYLIASAVKSGYVYLVVFLILGTLIALYYYFRFIITIFMSKPQNSLNVTIRSYAVIAVLFIAVITTVGLGFFPSYFFSTLERFATLP